MMSTLQLLGWAIERRWWIVLWTAVFLVGVLAVFVRVLWVWR